MPLVLLNQFSQEAIPCSSSTQGGLDFGFPAANVQVANDRATPVYVSFNSTTPSTGGFRTCASESITLAGLVVSAMALASTSTSTSTLVRVRAFGG